MIRMTPPDLWWLGSSLARAAGRALCKFIKIYKEG